jgi:predicted enzyme related to lactoylglutathione lyase
MAESPKVGTVGWMDLTVPDAVAVKDFYAAVTGWEPSPVNMGDYEDFCMAPSGSGPVAGVCHARGSNASLPPVWLIYITVADLDVSLAQVESKGGKIVRPATGMGGYGRYAVVQDPAGAISALFEPAKA